MKFARLAWSHEGISGAGEWHKTEARTMKQLEGAVDFGNAAHGAGTHWIEHCELPSTAQDLDEKLRSDHGATGWDAAQEIERLRAQVAEGRELLQQARDWIGAECDVCDRIDAYLAREKVGL